MCLVAGKNRRRKGGNSGRERERAKEKFIPL